MDKKQRLEALEKDLGEFIEFFCGKERREYFERHKRGELELFKQ